MTLQAIVRALGGDLYDQGLRANIPAPGHSAADRSLSLLLRDGRVIVHSFADGDWRGALDHLRALGLIGGDNAPLAGPGRPMLAAGGNRPSPSAVPAWRRRQVARALWAEGRPLGQCLAARHLAARAVGRPSPGEAALRFHPAAPLAVYRSGPARRPALLAAVLDRAGDQAAVELTYLAADGCRASDLRLPRKTVGVLAAGSAVRLDPPGPALLVAEGVFSALSASERFQLPAWALLSAGNLRAWTPPAVVRRVLIAADRGAAGESSAERLRGRLAAAGLAVRVALPPPSFGDWNDWARRARPQAPYRDQDGRAMRAGIGPALRDAWRAPPVA